MSSHGGQKRSHGVYISDSGGPLPRHQPAFNPQTAYVPTQQHTGPQTHNGNSGVGLTRTPQPSHREHQPLLHEIYPVAQHAQKRPRHDIVSDSRSHPPIYGPQIGVAPVQWHGGPQAPSVYGNVNSTGVERPLQPQHQQPQHTPPQHPQHQAIQYQHHQPLQHQPLQHQPLQYQPMQYQQSQHQHIPHEARHETPSANNMPYMGAPHSSHPTYHIAPTLRYALYAVRPMEDDRSRGPVMRRHEDPRDLRLPDFRYEKSAAGHWERPVGKASATTQSKDPRGPQHQMPPPSATRAGSRDLIGKASAMEPPGKVPTTEQAQRSATMAKPQTPSAMTKPKKPSATMKPKTPSAILKPEGRRAPPNRTLAPPARGQSGYVGSPLSQEAGFAMAGASDSAKASPTKQSKDPRIALHQKSPFPTIRAELGQIESPFHQRPDAATLAFVSTSDSGTLSEAMATMSVAAHPEKDVAQHQEIERSTEFDDTVMLDRPLDRDEESVPEQSGVPWEGFSNAEAVHAPASAHDAESVQDFEPVDDTDKVADHLIEPELSAFDSERFLQHHGSMVDLMVSGALGRVPLFGSAYLGEVPSMQGYFEELLQEAHARTKEQMVEWDKEIALKAKKDGD